MEENDLTIDDVLNAISDELNAEGIQHARAHLATNWKFFKSELGKRNFETLTSKEILSIVNLSEAEVFLTATFEGYAELSPDQKKPYNMTKRLLATHLDEVSDYMSQVKAAMQKGLIPELPDSEVAKAALFETRSVRYPMKEEKPQARNLLSAAQIQEYLEVLGTVPYSDNAEIRRSMDEKFITEHLSKINSLVAERQESQDITKVSEYDIIKGVISELKVQQYKAYLPYSKPGNDFYNGEFLAENLDQIENNIAYLHFGAVGFDSVRYAYSVERLDRALHPDKSEYTPSQLARADEDKEIILGDIRRLEATIMNDLNTVGLPNGLSLEEYMEIYVAHQKTHGYVQEIYPEGFSNDEKEMVTQLDTEVNIGINRRSFEGIVDEMRRAEPSLSTHELYRAAVERLEHELGKSKDSKEGINPHGITSLTLAEGIRESEMQGMFPELEESKRMLDAIENGEPTISALEGDGREND